MLSWRYPEDDEVRVARVGSKSAPRVLIRRKQTQTLRRFEDRCRHEGLSQKEYQGLLKTLTSYRSQRLLAYILQREHRSSDTSLPGSKFPVSKPENKSHWVWGNLLQQPYESNTHHKLLSPDFHFQIPEKYHLVKYFWLVWFLEWNKTKLENELQRPKKIWS